MRPGDRPDTGRRQRCRELSIACQALGGPSYGKAPANTAAVFFLGLGSIAALSQVGSATTPVLVAVLATVAGVIIVGVGGGLGKGWASRCSSVGSAT